MRRTTLLLGIVLLAFGCRSYRSQDTQRVTSIQFSSPSDPRRLLRGFGSGSAYGRFTNRVFAVALDRPELKDPATFLEMEFVVPLQKIGPANRATLTVRANGIKVCNK